MVKATCLFLLLGLSVHVFSQDSCTGRIPNQRYLEEIALFFQQVGSAEFPTDSIDVQEKVDMSEFLDFMEFDNWKIGLLTPEETAQFIELVKCPPLECWQSGLIPKASRFLTPSQISHMARNGYGYGYYSLGVPLFFRDFTVCVFTKGYYCGHLCGRGHMAVYKKIQGEWRRIEILSKWVS